MDRNDKQNLWLCLSIILAVEFLERIAFYGLIANLVLVSQSRFHFDNADSIIVTLIFLGFSNILPLLTTWLAESFLGKFNTILASCLIYNYGAAILLYLHHDNKSLSLQYERVLFVVALLAFTFGTAGMKSNISTFGINQIKVRIKKKNIKEQQVKLFFKWFYYLINIASFVCFTFLSYVQVYFPFYGCIPISSAIFLSLVLLIIGRRYFICVPCSGSQLSDIIRVIRYAIRRKVKDGRTMTSSLPSNMTLDLLDYAHMTYGGKYTTSQVDLVRCAIRIMIMQSSMIVYWIIYFQMSTTFILQGQQMKLSLIKHFKVPASCLSTIDIIMLIIVSKLLEIFILPCLRKINIRVTLLRKIGCGMFFGILSMIAAAITEWYRKHYMTNVIKNRFGSILFEASSLSIVWQIPQYVLMGVSEVLATISGLEFTYSQTPKFLHSVMMAFYLFSCGLGAFLACIAVKIISMTTNWICFDSNDCQFDYYFYFMAALCFLNIFYFLIVANKYSYVDDFFTGVPEIVQDSTSQRNSSVSDNENNEYVYVE